jgi:hypothetical protein
MLIEIPADQISAALDECAAEVLWEAGVTGPPVDAKLVARELGLVIAQDDALAARGDLSRLPIRGVEPWGRGRSSSGPRSGRSVCNGLLRMK